jgi:4-hydroxybenzoate polyprenyltransferase
MGITELLVIVALSELGLHYFPWRKLIKKELPRLGAYTLGLLGMMGPLSAWLMFRNEIEVIKTLWAVICTAGMTVFSLYGFDRYLDLEINNAENFRREKVMIEMLKGEPDEQSEQA